jgi:hypothetical protein
MNIKTRIDRMKNSYTIESIVMMAESIFFAVIAMFAIVPMAIMIASIIKYFFN